MSVIPKAYINSVVSIGVNAEEGFSWIGTGFLVGKKAKNNDGHYPYLITNRHIILDILNNKKDMYIRLIEKSTNKLKEYPVTLNDSDYVCSKDENVDLAVIFLNAGFLAEKIDSIGLFDIDDNSFTSDEFILNGGDEGSIVYMLGFPMGLIDEYSKLPICRMGCVARINEEEAYSKKRFILDIQNFPGNSGSPIICKGEVYSVDNTKTLNKCSLIGVVNSYIPYKESLVNAQTQEIVEIKSENSGLAIANPVECIKELIDIDMKKRELE